MEVCLVAGVLLGELSGSGLIGLFLRNSLKMVGVEWLEKNQTLRSVSFYSLLRSKY